jgi:hypothetical protein
MWLSTTITITIIIIIIVDISAHVSAIIISFLSALAGCR